jgi:alcohol dehydrogenase class IV
MKPFEFFSVPRVVFGRGVFSRVGELAAPLGRRAFVVSNARGDAVERLSGQLGAAGIVVAVVEQRGEPTVDQVAGLADAAHEHRADVVVGIGGGSAIDAAKAVAGLVANGGHPLDYLEVVGRGQKLARAALPWVAIPCTAGTGAEVTRNAVLGVPEKRFKASLRSEKLLAAVALVDPDLAVAVRPEVTARTGMDALCQCVEAYTSTGATAVTDAIAADGIRRAARALPAAFDDGADIGAREEMALAALYSGMALTNAGLGAVHGFAAPLGAAFPELPHGTICGALLAPVLAANVEALRRADPGHAMLRRYAEIAAWLGEGPDAALAPDAARRLAGHVRIPRLGAFGVTPAAVAAIVPLAQKASSMRFNPVALSPETLAQILHEAI